MIASILAAFGMCADGVAGGLYAIRHGFSARAASVAYAIGAVLAWVGALVTPITYTVESITVATRTAKKRPQVLYIVALSAIPSMSWVCWASIPRSWRCSTRRSSPASLPGSG